MNTCVTYGYSGVANTGPCHAEHGALLVVSQILQQNISIDPQNNIAEPNSSKKGPLFCCFPNILVCLCILATMGLHISAFSRGGRCTTLKYSRHQLPAIIASSRLDFQIVPRAALYVVR